MRAGDREGRAACGRGRRVGAPGGGGSGIGGARRRTGRLARRFCLLALSLVPPAPAQEAAGPPEADPADVASIDAIVAAVYDVISGPAGAARDWDRMHSLFLPEARLVPTWTDAEGGAHYRVLTVDDWIRASEPFLLENGFFEREVHRVEERFGDIAHLFSTYESRHAASDAEPFQRGINSFQLFHDGRRWWVLSIYWQAETEARPIPADYLP